MDFPGKIQNRFESAYQSTSNDLGWRFLYSPREVLLASKVAFIGLNPGGRSDTEGHAEFAMAFGSAYVFESWAGHPPGMSPLQVQVRTLFYKIGVAPERVLAGNLVPFRSPNWNGLKDQKISLETGKDIWKEVLGRVAPQLVIGMGRQLLPVLEEIAEHNDWSSHDIAWNGLCARSMMNSRGQRFVYLPHLSQYKIMRREKSKPALAEAFGEWWSV